MKKHFVFILICAMVLSLVSCGKGGSSGAEPSRETSVSGEAAEEETHETGNEYADYDLTGLHVLGSGFTDAGITDKTSVAEAVSGCSEAIGCKNALDELVPFASCSLDGKNYYRLQQYYKGIPVYGKYVVVVASNQGEALGLTTDAEDIPENLDLTPSITDADVAEAVREYAMYQWRELDDDITIQELSDDKLVIYDMDEVAGARLAYDLIVNNNGEYEVIADAQTAEILSSVNHMSEATGTTADGNLKTPVEYDEETGGYFVCDKESEIIVFDLCRTDFSKHEGVAEPLVSKGDTVFGNTEEEKEHDPEKAFKIMNSVLNAHDYFLHNFNLNTPTGQLFIFYNDSQGKGNNAGGTVYQGMAAICVGYKFTGDESDILAHEYTHTVMDSFHASDSGDLEAGIISEGLADVFGCFCTGDWYFDLTSTGRKPRDASDPTKYGYPDHINGKYSVNQDKKHAYATAISHAAYLMSESKAFTDKELQKLWYETMISLPQNCKFITLRSCMENVAIRSNCTAKQKQAIYNAFDAVGISYYEGAEKYNSDISLTVYDQRGNIYDDYAVKTYKLDEKASAKGKQDTYSTTPYKAFYQDKAQPLQLHFDEGTYRIVITDNAPSGKIQSYTVEIDPSNAKKEMLALDFGAAYTAAPNAKLTVLDADGAPLTDYNASVIGDSGQAITNGVIDLPENNYYTVLLSHREGTTVRLDMFTVRVKEGADDALVYESSFESDSAETEIREDLSKFNGLWITFSSIGTLYYFDNGEVTCYSKTDISSPLTDLHYKKESTQAYTVEDLASNEGTGSKAILEGGNEYWLRDDVPDTLDCFFHDENGHLQLSGSSSLMRVTDFTVDDLILEGDSADQDTLAENDTESGADAASESPYAEIVRKYENTYGELSFVHADGFDYYMGVFMAKLIDFDQDGSDELVIGYSEPREDVEQFIAAPKLDVWTMKDGVPVQAYAGANVYHGDIGSHCAYLDIDGKYYLCTGITAYETDLTLLSFENGSFREEITMQSEGDDSHYIINGRDVDADQWKELYQKIDSNPEENFHSGCLDVSGCESKEALQEAVAEDYRKLGM